MFRDITLRLWKSHLCSIGLRSCDFTAITTSRLLQLPITGRYDVLHKIQVSQPSNGRLEI